MIQRDQQIQEDMEASPLVVEQQQHTYQIVTSGAKRRIIISSREKCQLPEDIIPDETKRRIIISRENCQLPEDIIHDEMLTRLPAKSLLPMRRVCKSWKTLFSTSRFVKSHLTRPHSYKDQDLLIGQNKNLEENPGSHRLIIVSPSTEINLTAVTDSSLISGVLLGSINGLVCLASDSKQEFCLWNPAMGQFKKFYLQSQHSSMISTRRFLGFSWNHVLNDYKVVILSYASNPSSSFQLTSIYSSNSASWTQLVISDPLLPDISIFGDSLIKTPSAIVKGHPYWSYGDKSKYISVFKFVAETNEIRLLPNLEAADTVGKKEIKLVNIKDCLFGMAYTYTGWYEDNWVDIYSLDEESHTGVWSKMDRIGPIRIPMGNLWPVQCFKNGSEILMDGFVYGSLCVYDRETRQVKYVQSSGSCIMKRCFSYTPSLVCVQGMELMPSKKRERNGADAGSKEWSRCTKRARVHHNR